jgi:hypothetical protein
MEELGADPSPAVRADLSPQPDHLWRWGHVDRGPRSPFQCPCQDGWLTIVDEILPPARDRSELPEVRH